MPANQLKAKLGNPDRSEVMSCYILNSSVDEDVDYMVDYLTMVYKPYIG